MTSFMTYWKEVGQDKETLNWWLQMDVHGDANSRISEVESDSTAYSHRDKLWLFQFSSPLSPFDPDLEGAFALVNGYMDSIKDNLEDGEWGRYANYIDSELSREDAQVQYWSDHLEKLQAIKSELDPTQVFYNPQSIDPAAAE
jgi:FAD/FMN-containing dehydrogenase